MLGKIYIFVVVPCYFYYEIIKGLTKRLNDGKTGFIKISPEMFYRFISFPRNIIISFIDSVSFLIAIPVSLSIFAISISSKEDSMILQFILIFFVWQLLNIIQSFVLSYINHSYNVIFMNIFKFHQKADDESEIQIALYGSKNYRLIKLMNVQIKEATDYDLFKISNSGFLRSLFSKKIHMRLYALRKFYQQNPEIEPSEVESDIFIKSNGLSPGFFESAILHQSYGIYILCAVYLFIIFQIIKQFR